jgi:hypothetical protein
MAPDENLLYWHTRRLETSGIFMTAIQIRKRDWTSRFSFLFVLAITAVLWLSAGSLSAVLAWPPADAWKVDRGNRPSAPCSDWNRRYSSPACRECTPLKASRGYAYRAGSREGRILSAHISYTRTISLPFYDFKWPLVIHIVDTGL